MFASGCLFCYVFLRVNEMKIAEKLSLLRVKKGLSYGRLAQLARISPSTYLQWEQGVAPTRLKLVPVLDVFSNLYGMDIPEREMRDESQALRFDNMGKPSFARETVARNPGISADRGNTSTSLEPQARPETILEYEGIYSRLRVENSLTEQEAQMLLYLVKGFLAENHKVTDGKRNSRRRK